MARKRPGSHTPPRRPITRKLATQNTAIWSVTNNNPAAYWVRNSRSRLIGRATTRSIAPLAMKLGKMPAVEISAKIVAIHVSQAPIPRLTNIVLYSIAGATSLVVGPKLSPHTSTVSPLSLIPTHPKVPTMKKDRNSTTQNILRARKPR